jgi:hypothetical protein
VLERVTATSLINVHPSQHDRFTGRWFQADSLWCRQILLLFLICYDKWIYNGRRTALSELHVLLKPLNVVSYRLSPWRSMRRPQGDDRIRRRNVHSLLSFMLHLLCRRLERLMVDRYIQSIHSSFSLHFCSQTLKWRWRSVDGYWLYTVAIRFSFPMLQDGKVENLNGILSYVHLKLFQAVERCVMKVQDYNYIFYYEDVAGCWAPLCRQHSFQVITLLFTAFHPWSFGIQELFIQFFTCILGDLLFFVSPVTLYLWGSFTISLFTFLFYKRCHEGLNGEDL